MKKFRVGFAKKAKLIYILHFMTMNFFEFVEQSK